MKLSELGKDVLGLIKDKLDAKSYLNALLTCKCFHPINRKRRAHKLKECLLLYGGDKKKEHILKEIRIHDQYWCPNYYFMPCERVKGRRFAYWCSYYVRVFFYNPDFSCPLEGLSYFQYRYKEIEPYHARQLRLEWHI
jgi:hypothetical protein